MRRKGREVTDSMKIQNIISRCTCCRIGFYDGEEANYALNEADFACGYSARFQSIIGNGIVSIVSEINEKKLGFAEEHLWS